MNFHATTPINYRLNWVYPQKDPEWCQTFTQSLMCPKDKIFVEVDEKIYWVQDEIHRLLSHSAHRKNIINKKWLENPKILCVMLIWVYKLAKKISSHFDIGIHMLLFIQYMKEFLLIYINITVGFKKLTVMRRNRQWCLLSLLVYFKNR